MESQYQKWVNLSYLALAALVSYIVFSLGLKVTGTYDLETKVRNIELILRLSSLGLGAILFFVLSRHETANQFMNEVVTELARVTWPAQRETASATGLVIIMVLISGVILGFLDYVWTQLVQWVM